ncbi:hypothetical protein [Thalassospira povalilytica]|uniref:hypothetical protein n=1 Tax=Thalassospira povalilytica TaxID=732237 RepID=UPI001D184416|nr:hypothetical protein [Thalassospira povalilytica]MCC4240377.1 hypothetical protein [Thalassospira povalilytica]|tara:strand:+ start:1266 stop:1535 length:270 start_codon:yes stop_codon:yes gene_type:complete
MPAYIVCYDLHTPGQKYECLEKKIKAYGTWCHLQQSVWIVSTNQNSVSIRDNLKACLDSNDKLFVGRLSGEGAWMGYVKKTSDWLMDTL